MITLKKTRYLNPGYLFSSQLLILSISIAHSSFMKAELDLSLKNWIKIILHGKPDTLCKVRALYKHQ